MNTVNDDPLLEAFWVLFTYGRLYLVGGLAIALPIVLLGAGRRYRSVRVVVLWAAVLVMWGAMFLGVETGYSAWQKSPHVPLEAFSDTGGPMFMLFLGWMPSLILLGSVHLLLRWCWPTRTAPSSSSPGPQLGAAPAANAAPSDTPGTPSNPYRSPDNVDSQESG